MMEASFFYTSSKNLSCVPPFLPHFKYLKTKKPCNLYRLVLLLNSVYSSSRFAKRKLASAYNLMIYTHVPLVFERRSLLGPWLTRERIAAGPLVEGWAAVRSVEGPPRLPPPRDTGLLPHGPSLPFALKLGNIRFRFVFKTVIFLNRKKIRVLDSQLCMPSEWSLSSSCQSTWEI